MKGEYEVVVRNNKVQIKLIVRRNLTILQGNSATGKTTLVDLIRQYDELGRQSGVTVACDVPCKALSGRYWNQDLARIENSIVFIDEDNAFMKTHEFALAAKNSSNYYVLVAREALPQLPYSVDEIYGLRNTGRAAAKYPSYKRVYTSSYRIYGAREFNGERPDLVVVEDSNSGYEFFRALCERSGVPCVAAGGKSRIYDVVRNASQNDVLVIADGAAFGPEMSYMVSLQRFKTVRLFLPESFEWLVLKSGVFRDERIRKMLLHPSDYIDSSRFFSWEQFFTAELIAATRDSYLAYQKARLNPAYLRPDKQKKIESVLPDLGV